MSTTAPGRLPSKPDLTATMPTPTCPDHPTPIILDAVNNQPLAPDLAAEVADLVADLDTVLAHYQALAQDPSDNWDFEAALNALGSTLYANCVDAIVLPDGRTFSVRTHEVVNRYIYLDIAPANGGEEATYWADDNESIDDLWLATL